MAAIGAGLLAQFAASSVPLTQVSDTVWYGGVTTPFDVSFVFLVAAIPFICYLWQAGTGMLRRICKVDDVRQSVVLVRKIMVRAQTRLADAEPDCDKSA